MSTSPDGPATADAPQNGGGPLLSLKGVTKSFGPVRALSSVDLDVPHGEVTALVGDNGAGKSSLIKTVSGLWAPDGGQILWEGNAGPSARPQGRRGARHHHDLSGPRAVRQPGHRPEHVPRP